ncbi:hypothetical protein FACS189437_10060 [Bacteroidia bacterium]|nr:hypothetical protein FACS189437_10060 [Bacteroidia bacterium]
MTELVLKSNVDRKKLEGLLLFLKLWDIDAEIKTTEAKESKRKDIFADVRGIWADRDIDIEDIRKKSYERRTKLYDL